MFNCVKCGIIKDLYIIDIINYNGEVKKKCGICEGVYYLNKEKTTSTATTEPPATTEPTTTEPPQPPQLPQTAIIEEDKEQPHQHKKYIVNKKYKCKHKQKPQLKCVCKNQTHIKKKIYHIKYRMSKRLIMYI